MSDGFNPYREWLGLSASSPNHYELLGLPLQESNTAAIASAADRAMTRVRSHRPGPQGREWANLLDEIRAAKECLLDPVRRAQYDTDQARAATAAAILPPESDAEIRPPAFRSATTASSDRFPPSPNRPTTSQPASSQSTTFTQQIPDVADLPDALPVALPSSTPTWFAGPSPIYDSIGNQTAASQSIPVATPITAPLPAMPLSAPVVQQTVLPASYGAPQRATFRNAGPSPPQNPPRPRGRGATWAAIVLLWLVVGGLTYRLSIVARQRQQAEAAAAQAAANQATTQSKAASSRGKSKNVPDSQTQPFQPTTNSTTSALNNSASAAKITRAQVQPLINSLQAAKAAIVVQDFPTADAQIAQAASVSQLSAHRAAVSRLKQVNEYVKRFRQALASAVAEMHIAETFDAESTHWILVESRPDAVVLRTAGKNETHAFNDMPPGLAIALADRKLPPNDPQTLITKGAYLLLNKKADSQSRAKAEALWNEANAAGAKIDNLLPLLTDGDYSALLNDAAE